MLLAETDLISHLGDRPWPGMTFELWGLPVTLMSSAIAAMVITAVVLVAVLIPSARREQTIPTGFRNALEVLVLFVRDRIARPSLHEHADAFLPFLLTIFVFILGLNLLGMVPLEGLTQLLHLETVVPLGTTATSVFAVCCALGSITLITIVSSGLHRAAQRARDMFGWPMAVAMLISPVLWFKSLAPHVPGATGKVLGLPLALLEFVGAVMKCFALVIRLLANMMAGHALLGVLVMFVLQTLTAWAERGAMSLLYVGPISVVASVGVSILELLVAGLQAYIFTFLTAMFLGLYVEPAH